MNAMQELQLAYHEARESDPRKVVKIIVPRKMADEINAEVMQTHEYRNFQMAGLGMDKDVSRPPKITEFYGVPVETADVEKPVFIHEGDIFIRPMKMDYRKEMGHYHYFEWNEHNRAVNRDKEEIERLRAEIDRLRSALHDAAREVAKYAADKNETSLVQVVVNILDVLAEKP